MDNTINNIKKLPLELQDCIFNIRQEMINSENKLINYLFNNYIKLLKNSYSYNLIIDELEQDMRIYINKNNLNYNNFQKLSINEQKNIKYDILEIFNEIRSYYDIYNYLF